VKIVNLGFFYLAIKPGNERDIPGNRRDFCITVHIIRVMVAPELNGTSRVYCLLTKTKKVVVLLEQVPVLILKFKTKKLSQIMEHFQQCFDCKMF